MHRVTGYYYEVPDGFDEYEVEKVLARAVADGAVTEFDTGRGRIVWFNGKPSAELRSVRDRVVAMLGPSARRVGATEAS